MRRMPRPIKRIFSSPTKTVFRRALYGVPMAVALSAFLLAGNALLNRVTQGVQQLPRALNQQIVSSSMHFQLANPLFDGSQTDQTGDGDTTQAAPSRSREPQRALLTTPAPDCTTTPTYQELTARESALLQQLKQTTLGVEIDPLSLPTQFDANALKSLDGKTRAELIELQTVMAQLQKTARC